MLFLLLYGVLQEFVVMNKFKKSFGWFVTFLQLSGYAIFGVAQNQIIGMTSNSKGGGQQQQQQFDQHIRRIPFSYYFILAVLQVIMQGFTNFAMQFLNYPAKTLFKSSRVIVTILFGVVFMKKKYPVREYIVAIFILLGLSTFVAADVNSAPAFDSKGIIYIIIALIADAAILNVQEYCLHKFDASHDELVYYSFLGAASVSFWMSLLAGLFFAFLKFIPNSIQCLCVML